MKFTFDRDAIAKELSIAQEIISSKNQASIMSNIMLTAENNTLTMTATNSAINFQTSLPVEIEEEGISIVLCSKFLEILSSLPPGIGEIEFNQQMNTVDDTPLSIRIKPVSKRVKFELTSLTSEKFPEVKAESTDAEYFEIPAKELKKMIQQTVFAVSTDEQRVFMSGVYFDKTEDNKFVFVATDAKRLALASLDITTEIPKFPSVIIPTKILTIISKHMPDEGMIAVAVTQENIFFKFGGYKLSSSLIKGQYPAYQRVIPQNQAHSVKLLKSDLVDAIKRITIMTEKNMERIYLNIQPGVLRVMSSQSDQGTAEEEIPAEYADEEMTIAVNYKYIDQPLRVMQGENTVLEFTEEMKALTLRPEPADSYFHIIMPMQKD